MTSQIFETVIRQALVLDGSGRTSYIADIGMADGVISAIAPKLSVKHARRIIDADGLAAAPGFIDSHSHDDVYLLADPNGTAKISQGITTVIIGNCGFSIAPILPETQSQAMASLGIIGASHLPRKLDQGWRFSEFLDILEQVQPAINVVPLVGHGTLRIAAMGIDNRPADFQDRLRMRELLEESMRAGAFGLSSGLVYVPGAFANTDELIDLARVTAANGGLYTTHMRSEADQVMDAIDEALEIGRQARLPVHISHHKVMGRKNWGRSQETLEYLQKARVEGMRVTCDVYPYTAGSTSLASALPPSLQAEGSEVFAEKLKNQIVRSEVRKIIENETSGDWENLIYVDTFEGMVLVRAPRNPQYCGRSIADIAEKERRDPYDVFFDLVVEEKMDAVIVEFMMQEDDVIRILKSPFSMVATDGLPGFGSDMFHPRFTGAFPRVLGRYVREKQCLTLEQAVWKMTGLPADTFGLNRKGHLAAGYDADIVLFDPLTITDLGTYESPNLKPEGIQKVWVNGRLTLSDDLVSSKRYGRVLRRNK
jgi:N-acyl-D-amino-acid deacylase